MAQRGNLLRPLIRFAPNFSGSGQTAFGPLAAGRGLADQGAGLRADVTKGERPILGWKAEVRLALRRSRFR